MLVTRRFGRCVLIAAFALVLVLPFARRAPRAGRSGGPRLVVLTPHNEHIRYEIEEAFRAWHETGYGAPAEIDWRVVGGSSDIQRLLSARYEVLAREGREEEGAGYDVVLGGGDYLFDKPLKRGVTVRDARGQTRAVSITQPIALDAAFLSAVYPEPAVAGRPLYDPEGHWWGVVLSTFGVIYNRDVLRAKRLPEPRTWEDLTDPRYFGWIALVDPSHSGSIRTTYEAILQRYGWEKGWRTLREASANARYFASESAQVPVDVSMGEAAGGMCVDHYARQQQQVIGGERLGFAVPWEATVVNADPVAVLRGAGQRELAERFVRFLLGEEGQAVWCFDLGEPQGPKRFRLCRPPARRGMYRHVDRMVERDNPFESARALPPDAPAYFDVLPTVLHAMVIDVHDDLSAAWRAVGSAPSAERRSRMLALFHELPFSPDELRSAPRRWTDDRAAKDRDRLQWTRFFRERYQAVAAMR
jgi:ABC-type thiamine transport system substrate-binding protein